MKIQSATLEVQQEGQKSRLFRFEETEITIGFSANCHVSLEPHAEAGPELMLITRSGEPCCLRARRDPKRFQLNGKPCLAEMTVKPGDVITGDSYRIRIRTLPLEPEAPGSAQAEPKEEEAPTSIIDITTPTVLKSTVPHASPAPVKELNSTKPAPAQPRIAPITTTEVTVATEEGKTAKVPSPKAGLSYLYLFFAPVQEFLIDDNVSEIMINGPRQVYIERKGKLAAVSAKFASEQALQAAVMNVARSVGRFFDKDNPRLDARLPDGSRVHAVMPPLSRVGTTIAIRKFRREKLTLQQLIDLDTISAEGARLLEIIVRVGKNLLVSGATSSGKTSVLNVLSALIPASDRILVLEDASELQLQQSHVVSFETRKPDEHGKGEVTIRDLLHSALRLRPDRLVVGEIRGGEALDLLQAMNTGHEGSMSTIHANSARDSLFRLETCALLSGIEIPLSALREQVASAIQVVIQTARLFDGSRKITSITEVLGLKEREYQLKDILVFQQEGLAANGTITGRYVFTGYEPTFLGVAKQRGFELAGLFST